MRLPCITALTFLLACGGGAETAAPVAAPADQAALPANPAAALGAAAADAVGACKELDVYATAVESYVATFEQLDVRNQASVMAVQKKGLELAAQAQSFTSQAWYATPGCVARAADISARMNAAGARMEQKAAELSGQAADMSACMMQCQQQGDPTQMGPCIQACQGR